MKSIRLCALASAALLLGSMVVAQTGPARQAPPATPAAPPKAAVTDQQKNAAEEISLAEEILSAREKYQKQLEKLVELYVRTNNEFKAKMAREELESLRKGKQFNYIVDIYTKWYRNYFYFCAKYACPGPNATSPFFETKFARLEYVGSDRFHLSFMRHTEEWVELYQNLSLNGCLEAIRNEPYFQP